MDDGGHVGKAQRALERGDAAAAFGHLQDAVAEGPDPLAREMLGGLLMFDDDLEGARREWETAFREWKDAGRPRQAALMAAAVADLHASAFGNRAAGAGWVARARRLLAPEGRCVEAGYVELAYLACEAADVTELERAADLAFALAQEFEDHELAVRALADGGYALVVQGRVADGFARLDEAMAALSAGEVRNVAVACMSYCALLAACDRTGDVPRAEEWIRVIARNVTDPFEGRPRAMHTHCRLAYGSVLCTAGRPAEGEAAIAEVLSPAGSRLYAHRAEAATRLASLRLLQGRTAEAVELVRPYEGRASACETLAAVHLATGDPDLAAAVARRGLDIVVGDRLRAGSVRSLLVEVELARGDAAAAAGHADALDELAAVTDSRLLHADAEIARGRVAAAEPDAHAAVKHFERAASYLRPDERPLHAATIALELAQALAETGDSAAAVDQARTALSCFERLGAVRLADRADALLRSLGARGRTATRDAATAVAGLSRREQEVLDLLRGGLTNAEIGDRLFISAKTAEHHVGRVLAKLGVRSRAEAAAVAAAAAAVPAK